MTKEEQAVIDTAMAWMETRFTDYGSPVQMRAFQDACFTLRRARVSPEQLAQILKEDRAYQTLQQAVWRNREILGDAAYDQLHKEVEKSLEEKTEVPAWTTEKLKAYTGRGDL